MTIEELKAAVVKPDDERIFVVAEMLRRYGIDSSAKCHP